MPARVFRQHPVVRSYAHAQLRHHSSSSRASSSSQARSRSCGLTSRLESVCPRDCLSQGPAPSLQSLYMCVCVCKCVCVCVCMCLCGIRHYHGALSVPLLHLLFASPPPPLSRVPDPRHRRVQSPLFQIRVNLIRQQVRSRRVCAYGTCESRVSPEQRLTPPPVSRWQNGAAT